MPSRKDEIKELRQRLDKLEGKEAEDERIAGSPDGGWGGGGMTNPWGDWGDWGNTGRDFADGYKAASKTKTKRNQGMVLQFKINYGQEKPDALTSRKPKTRSPKRRNQKRHR